MVDQPEMVMCLSLDMLIIGFDEMWFDIAIILSIWGVGFILFIINDNNIDGVRSQIARLEKKLIDAGHIKKTQGFKYD